MIAHGRLILITKYEVLLIIKIAQYCKGKGLKVINNRIMVLSGWYFGDDTIYIILVTPFNCSLLSWAITTSTTCDYVDIKLDQYEEDINGIMGIGKTIRKIFKTRKKRRYDDNESDTRRSNYDRSNTNQRSMRGGIYEPYRWFFYLFFRTWHP